MAKRNNRSNKNNKSSKTINKVVKPKVVKPEKIIETKENIEEVIKPVEPIIEPEKELIKETSKGTKTEELHKKIVEASKPKKQVKVRYPNGYTCMMNIEIAKRLEKKDKFKVLV
jgi:hypothetical protein